MLFHKALIFDSQIILGGNEMGGEPVLNTVNSSVHIQITNIFFKPPAQETAAFHKFLWLFWTFYLKPCKLFQKQIFLSLLEGWAVQAVVCASSLWELICLFQIRSSLISAVFSELIIWTGSVKIVLLFLNESLQMKRK